MRKIEEQMLRAVRDGHNWRSGNTQVNVIKLDNDNIVLTHVFLHGNLIYFADNKGREYFSFAGWDTPTTRSRLRALGLPIVSKNRQRYAYGFLLPIHFSTKLFGFVKGKDEQVYFRYIDWT